MTCGAYVTVCTVDRNAPGGLLVVCANQVEGGTSLEPCPLLFVVGVAEGDVVDRAILVVGDERELGTRS